MRKFIPPRRRPIGEKWRCCVDCGVAANTSTTGVGRLYPESQMVEEDGKWRCKQHYAWRWKNRIDGEIPSVYGTDHNY